MDRWWERGRACYLVRIGFGSLRDSWCLYWRGWLQRRGGSDTIRLRFGRFLGSMLLLMRLIQDIFLHSWICPSGWLRLNYMGTLGELICIFILDLTLIRSINLLNSLSPHSLRDANEHLEWVRPRVQCKLYKVECCSCMLYMLLVNAYDHRVLNNVHSL